MARRRKSSGGGGRALVVVAKETLDNLQKHLDQIEGFVKAGTRPEIDLAQARTDLANGRVSVIDRTPAQECAWWGELPVESRGDWCVADVSDRVAVRDAVGHLARTPIDGLAACAGMVTWAGVLEADFDEVDRIMDRIHNLAVYGPDLKPLMVRDPKTGEMVVKRVPRTAARWTVPFTTAVDFMLESATRKEAVGPQTLAAQLPRCCVIGLDRVRPSGAGLARNLPLLPSLLPFGLACAHI